MPRGGKRLGAGRPKGSGWKPRPTDLRQMAAVWSTQVIGTRKDPLGFMIELAADAAQPITTRMTAATAVIPFLYPKLSAATVDAHVTTTRADGRSLLAELEARLCRVPLIEARPEAPEEAVEAPGAPDGDGSPAESPHAAPGAVEAV